MSQQSFFQDPQKSVQSALSLRVLVPMPVDKAYDYAVEEDYAPGTYVTVPVGSRELPGVIWGEAEGRVSKKKLKSVLTAHDLRPMSEVQRKFIDWVADYTMTPRGQVLKMSLSVPGALQPPAPMKAFRISESQNLKISDVKLTEKQRLVVNALSDGAARRASEIAEEAGVSAAVVSGMAKKGLLEVVEIRSAAPCRNPDPAYGSVTLSPEQEEIAATIRAQPLKPMLLDGVTGAGKTEVYFEGVAKALEEGKQVLLMLPEIALSNAFLERFKSRFGCAPALWHSGLTPAQRKKTWRGVASGETRVVVGARSALFLPYADLGLIIVDEEHDPAYKQEEGALYHARDMAVARAHLAKHPILLVSATPSLETMQNAWDGRYIHLQMADRYGGARLPDIHLIDMRDDKPEAQHFIAPSLKAQMVETLNKGEQVLLFLNRRGYAPLTLCRTCGHRMNCPRCTAWLVEHKRAGRLQCHHCGFSQSIPQHCPECGDEDSLAACGPGVERIHEEVKALFPDARTLLLASDTAESQEQLKEMLSDIREQKVDIVIGTQIIAKGHHFPGLTLVGVIDADLGLAGGELRAAERTYQLLHQVAGRAGREGKKGHVYLQTFMPEHPIMQALQGGGRDLFLEAESGAREMAHMPPFGRLVGIIVSGRDAHQVDETASALGRTAPQAEGVTVLGPAPAPFAMLRGRHRRRLLVQAEKNIHIQKTIEAWVGAHKIPSAVRVQIDIDPQSFL